MTNLFNKLSITNLTRILVLIMLAGFVMFIFPVSMGADSTYELSYDVIEGEAVVTGFSRSPDVLIDLVIPSTVGTYTVKGVSDNAFSGSSYIRSVTVEDGVESIGSNAFYSCEYLEYADISGVKTVGSSAFKACMGLSSVELGEGLTTISQQAFYNCRKLRSIVIPSTVSKVDAGIFTQCRVLQTVVFLGEDTNTKSAFSNTIGMGLSTPTHYYVRNQAAKDTMISNGVSAENITIINNDMLVLKDGYKNGIESVIGCDNTVTLPECSRLRYIFKGWTDGTSVYPAGTVYNVKNFAVMSALWQIDTSETARLTVQEFKENIYNKKSTDELVRWDESHIVDNSITMNVSVDEGNVVMKDNLQRLFGVQFEISNDKLMNTENQLSQSYLASAENIGEIPIARWGGLYTNRVNLIKSVGPYETRGSWTSLSIEDGTTETRGPIKYGPVEFIKTVLAVNPDAEFIFVISMFDQTPEETAQFVHFLLDDKNSSPWGALRASVGLEEPINVLGFELGNENYHSIGVTFPGFDQPFTAQSAAEYYTDKAIQHAQAIHNVNEDLKIMPVVIRESTPEKGMVWNRIVAKKLGAYTDDLVAIHFYSGNSTFRHKANDDIYNNIKQIFKEETAPDKEINFAVTEHALTSEGNYVSYTSLWACLTDSLFFANAMNNGDVELATYHNFYSSNLWSYVQDTDGKYIPTGIADFYNLYKSMLGDRVVKTTYTDYDNSDNSPQQYASVVSMATGDDELTLVLTNSSNYNEYNINFDFINEYELVSETTFTAPNYYSYKSSSNTMDIFTTTTVERSVENFSSYSLGSKRVVFLKLRAKTPIVTVEKTNPAATEASDVIYRDLLYGAVKDDDVYYFANPDKVRRIDYSGTNSDVRISLKNISGVWEQFAVYSSFEKGKMLNSYNENLYTAARIENADASEVNLFAQINHTADIPFAESSFRLYPRINGNDCFESYSAETNIEYLTFENGGFTINKTGESQLTIGNNTVTVNVFAETDVFEFTEDFDNKETAVVSGNGDVLEDWILYKSSSYAQFGFEDFSNYTEKSGKGLVIIPYSSSSAVYNSAVAYYNGDLSGLSDRYTLRFDIMRTHASDVFGARFMVHNEGKNYYHLQLQKYDDLMSPAWILYKVTDEQPEEVAVGYTYGNRLGTGVVSFEIMIDRGNISWKAYSNNDINDELCGQYYDANPFSLNGSESTFGFFGSYTGNLVDKNAVCIDNVSISGIDVCDDAQYMVKNGLVYISADTYKIADMPATIGGYAVVYTDGEMYYVSSESAQNTVAASDVAAKNITVVESAKISGTAEYELSYSINEDGKSLSVTGFSIYPSEKYTLVIPDSAMFDVDGDGVKELCPITAVSDGAFKKGCNSNYKDCVITYNEKIQNDLLTGLQIGANVCVLGTGGSSYTGVILYAPKLTEVIIPDNVTSFGKQVFFRTGVTSIEIGKGVKVLDYKSLSSNKNLVTVKTYASEFNNGAFYGCGKIANLYLYAHNIAIKNNTMYSGLAEDCVIYTTNKSVKNYLVSCGHNANNIVVDTTLSDKQFYYDATNHRICIATDFDIPSAKLVVCKTDKVTNNLYEDIEVIQVENVTAGEQYFFYLKKDFDSSKKYRVFLFENLSALAPLLPSLEIIN